MLSCRAWRSRRRSCLLSPSARICSRRADGCRSRSGSSRPSAQISSSSSSSSLSSSSSSSSLSSSSPLAAESRLPLPTSPPASTAWLVAADILSPPAVRAALVLPSRLALSSRRQMASWTLPSNSSTQGPLDRTSTSNSASIPGSYVHGTSTYVPAGNGAAPLSLPTSRSARNGRPRSTISAAFGARFPRGRSAVSDVARKPMEAAAFPSWARRGSGCDKSTKTWAARGRVSSTHGLLRHSECLQQPAADVPAHAPLTDCRSHARGARAALRARAAPPPPSTPSLWSSGFAASTPSPPPPPLSAVPASLPSPSNLAAYTVLKCARKSPSSIQNVPSSANSYPSVASSSGVHCGTRGKAHGAMTVRVHEGDEGTQGHWAGSGRDLGIEPAGAQGHCT